MLKYLTAILNQKAEESKILTAFPPKPTALINTFRIIFRGFDSVTKGTPINC